MISIIIPTYIEGENITKTINGIKKKDKENLISEIIVSDGQSTDDTVSVISNAGVTVVVSPKNGRSAQVNYGASVAEE